MCWFRDFLVEVVLLRSSLGSALVNECVCVGGRPLLLVENPVGGPGGWVDIYGI